MSSISSSIVSRVIAAGLYERESSSSTSTSSSSSGLPTYAIVAIVVLGLALVTTGALTYFFLRRRRQRQRLVDNEDGWRDSFIPNSFEVIGGIYSKRPSRTPSHLERSNAPSPYQPTTEYGQYRPPLPKPAYQGTGRPHNPANLVRHARDKSLPLVPQHLP